MHVPDTVEKCEIQKNWDDLKMKSEFDELLNNSEPIDSARLLASSTFESSKWLQVIPSFQLGLLLDNNTTRIAVALRLGGSVCEQHKCRCGVEVMKNGHLGLCCIKSARRPLRHYGFNNITSQALTTARFPNLLEPPGISRSDNKRPDGVTIMPWERGKSLLWDATIKDTLAPSYLHLSSVSPGSVADLAERNKHNHYIDLKRNYLFTPVAFETFGPKGDDTRNFINKLGKHLIKETGDKRSKDYLLRRYQ